MAHDSDCPILQPDNWKIWYLFRQFANHRFHRFYLLTNDRYRWSRSPIHTYITQRSPIDYYYSIWRVYVNLLAFYHRIHQILVLLNKQQIMNLALCIRHSIYYLDPHESPIDNRRLFRASVSPMLDHILNHAL